MEVVAGAVARVAREAVRSLEAHAAAGAAGMHAMGPSARGLPGARGGSRQHAATRAAAMFEMSIEQNSRQPRSQSALRCGAGLFRRGNTALAAGGSPGRDRSPAIARQVQ